MLNSLQLALCEMQAKLFELSVDRQYESESFIKEYMNSKTVKALDSSINHLQWAGTKYVMAQVEDELRNKLCRSPHLYDKETMYWTGYLYRYWHYYTGESSKEIYRQAPASTMRVVFLPYHTLGNELAIDRLKETNMEKQIKQLNKKPRFRTKIGCYPNDATYRGNAVDNNFSFLSPIARVHDDEDDFNRNWVYLSDYYKNGIKNTLIDLNQSHQLELPANNDLTSYDNPDYLWLSYELNNLIRAFNKSMAYSSPPRQIPYAQILLQALAMHDSKIYPKAKRIPPRDGKPPHYLIVFEQPFLKKYMEFIFGIFDDNPQIFHEKDGKHVVDYQFRAPIYRQPPFDKYFKTRHDLPAIIYHKSIQMMLAHELAHIGHGHLDLQATDPIFGNDIDTLISEETEADNQAICWVLGIRYLESDDNHLDITYEDFFQELSLTVFAVYLLYTWSYQGKDRIWSENTVEKYGHQSHLPYQLRAFNTLQICLQRMNNLAEWSEKGRVVTKDGIPITKEYMQSAFDESMMMIVAYETSLHMLFAKTERFCELSENGQWDEINKMIVAEQNEQLPKLSKYQFPWLLGLEPQGQKELKCVHDLWKPVRERLMQNGTYCDLPPFRKWVDLPSLSKAKLAPLN